MKIALIGATGFVGGNIMAEALNRGHEVTGVVRNPYKLPAHKNLKGIKCDVNNEKGLTDVIRGHDAVISAFNPGWKDPDIREHFINGTKSIINAVKQSGVKRIIVVGGAGSLEIEPGVQLVDTPEFPQEFREGALGAREALNMIKKESSLEWTFVSPSIMLQPGERTGKFRIGTDTPLFDEKGESKISVQDLAAAIMDEIEKPEFIRKRFTAGY